MNELVTLEQVQTGTASEEVFDLVEELKTAQDRMETLKYQFQQIAPVYLQALDIQILFL